MHGRRGPYYFKIAGPLESQSNISHLHEISIPILIIHAKHDGIHEIALADRPFLECIERQNVELSKSSYHPMHEELET